MSNLAIEVSMSLVQNNMSMSSQNRHMYLVSWAFSETGHIPGVSLSLDIYFPFVALWNISMHCMHFNTKQVVSWKKKIPETIWADGFEVFHINSQLDKNTTV